ncbi:MAG: Gfo/Idh/MocA family oxidoreductase [Proteobacteria bacterium]|nr:Gfo/Idh/MocA family oxidoreductase [Pseudomonadota bacterium]
MFTAAVIGCGRMGAFTSESVRRFAPACWLPLAHAEAIQSLPGLELQALADPQPETLARAQQHYGVKQGFTDGATLLKAVRPELVGIATRTIGREALIAQAVECGARALHIEKPLCNSMAELAALEKLFRRDDLFVTYGAIRRHLHPYLHARALVESGVLGRLLEVQVNFGPGALYWTHPHSLDLLLFATRGRCVVSASARLSDLAFDGDGHTVLSDPQVESASLMFSDGVEGRITCTPGCDLVFACERGQVIVENDGHAVLHRQSEGGDPYPVARPVALEAAGMVPTGTAAAMAHLLSCLRGDPEARDANAALRQDILLGQRLLFTLLQSHLEGGSAVAPAAVDPTLCVLARSGALHA